MGLLNFTESFRIRYIDTDCLQAFSRIPLYAAMQRVCVVLRQQSIQYLCSDSNNSPDESLKTFGLLAAFIKVLFQGQPDSKAIC